MNRKFFLAFLLLILCLVSYAYADETQPQKKEVENTWTYESETLQVKVEQWHYAFKGSDLRFFAAYVTDTNPEQLRTAFAGEEYSMDSAESTKDIADRHNAVLAVNGDYYNFNDKLGMVIRNGVLYRDGAMTGFKSTKPRDTLLIDNRGMFSGIHTTDFVQGQGQSYVDAGIQQSFIFGPILVENSAACTFPKDYVIATRENIREPRTAIGQIDANHYVLVVADGRRDLWSDKGMTLRELQQFFLEQGCTFAYNLDGGGSATMVFKGEQLNKTSGSRERDVSDIVYFCD